MLLAAACDTGGMDHVIHVPFIINRLANIIFPQNKPRVLQVIRQYFFCLFSITNQGHDRNAFSFLQQLFDKPGANKARRASNHDRLFIYLI